MTAASPAVMSSAAIAEAVIESAEVSTFAKERLLELIPEKFLLETYRDKGKFGRVLGVPLTVDHKSVCEILIKEGHAREYSGGTKEPWVPARTIRGH